jgi:protein-tyrosine phosphatase
VNHPHKLKQLTDMGCYLQITSSSLTGKFGNDAQKNALKLIDSSLITCVASDCHNLKSRRPDLLSCKSAIFDVEKFNILTNSIPTLITNHS